MHYFSVPFRLHGLVGYAGAHAGHELDITIQMGSNASPRTYPRPRLLRTATASSVSSTSMPTNADCNFIVFIVKDANGVVGRLKGFGARALPEGATNEGGGERPLHGQNGRPSWPPGWIGTDDPIAVAIPDHHAQEFRCYPG